MRKAPGSKEKRNARAKLARRTINRKLRVQSGDASLQVRTLTTDWEVLIRFDSEGDALRPWRWWMYEPGTGLDDEEAEIKGEAETFQKAFTAMWDQARRLE